MARSRYIRSSIIDKHHYASFILEQTNAFREPDTFKDVKTKKYTVKLGDRLDHLAAVHLNDDQYWWAIALVSNLVSPFLTPGQKILIPFDIQDILDRM